MISKEIVQSVLKQYTRAGKTSAKKIRDYIAKYEPDFEKYLEQSTWDDVQSLVTKYMIPPTKELMEGIASMLVGAKIEGYLIHSVAQNKFWANKYGISIDGELTPEDKFKIFLEGKLDPVYYQYELTSEEKADKNNFKKIALDNFNKNQMKLNIENELYQKDVKLNKDTKPISKSVSQEQVGDLLD